MFRIFDNWVNVSCTPLVVLGALIKSRLGNSKDALRVFT